MSSFSQLPTLYYISYISSITHSKTRAANPFSHKSWGRLMQNTFQFGFAKVVHYIVLINLHAQLISHAFNAGCFKIEKKKVLKCNKLTQAYLRPRIKPQVKSMVRKANDEVQLERLLKPQNQHHRSVKNILVSLASDKLVHLISQTSSKYLTWTTS